MSAQIDIISECKEPGQGSCVRIEEIAKASSPTLDDGYRFAEPSVNLTWPLCAKSSLRLLADELETKTEVQSLFVRLLPLASDGLGDLSRGNRGFFRFSTRKFLEITPIDISHKITIYKTVIIFARKEGICDFWPVGCPIGGDITAAISFQEFLCTPSFAVTSDWKWYSSVFLKRHEVSTAWKRFAQHHDLPGTIAGPCR
jgi:hypothetical protein